MLEALMHKWKLMFTTIPVVFAVTGIRYLLRTQFGWEGVIEFSDLGIVLTGCVFLFGLLLTGTLSDYKEAEKLPGEIATTLETIEEIFVLASTGRGALSLEALRRDVLRLTDGIRDWLFGRAKLPKLHASLSEMNTVFQTLELAGAGSWASRAIVQLGILRRGLARIDVISRTGFLPSGYALLEVLMGVTTLLLLISRFHSHAAELTLVPFVTLLNVYLIRLIRDVDDPFQYEVDGKKRGGAEVDLFPIEEYRQRLHNRASPSAVPDRDPGAA
jgi:hypothetical protein